MSLIHCHECGREISDKAMACPGCGCPLKRQSITFTDSHAGPNPPRRNYRFLRALVNRMVVIGLLLGGGYLLIRYDVAGLGKLLSFQTVFSSKIDKAEAYLMERIDNPSTYQRLEVGPLEKRYDYSQLGDVFVTWLAYEFQDDFGNVKRQKAYFKIDAATEKIVDFKVQ